MDEIKSYLRQIGDYPVLTREQETALFKTMRGNDKAKAEKARDTLAKCNLKLVFANAKKYANCGVALADLVQEGSVLMCEDTTIAQLHDMIHIHPTLSEVLYAAAE